MYKIEFRNKDGRLLYKKIYETEKTFNIWYPKHNKRKSSKMFCFKYEDGGWKPITPK